VTQDQTQIETGHAIEMQPVCIASAALSETVTDADPTLEELLEAREALDARIKLATKLQRSADLAACRKLVSLHGFGAAELGIVAQSDSAPPAQASTQTRAAAVRPPVPAKYRNPETGDAWTGRGLKPKWVEAALAEGKSLDDLLISSEPDA
jgi:DNA-binding protein H-NS